MVTGLNQILEYFHQSKHLKMQRKLEVLTGAMQLLILSPLLLVLLLCGFSGFLFVCPCVLLKNKKGNAMMPSELFSVANNQ